MAARMMPGGPVADAVFADLGPRIEKLVWVIVLILCLIYALTLLAGGGGTITPFHR